MPPLIHSRIAHQLAPGTLIFDPEDGKTWRWTGTQWEVHVRVETLLASGGYTASQIVQIIVDAIIDGAGIQVTTGEQQPDKLTISSSVLEMLKDHGVDLIASPLSINFAGPGVVVTHDGGGNVTVTIA